MTRLVEATPEPLTSNMRVSTAMILDVVDRPGDPFVAMRRLLTENHEPRKRQLQHIREAVGIARSLLQAGVLERLDEPEADGRRYRLTVDLPPDFALNQPLSTFALAAVDVLDPASETHALDVVSVIEATLEDPRQILAAQLNKARGEAVAADEGRGHRVRRADGAARRRHLSRSRSRNCSDTPSRCTCRATRGRPTRGCRRSPIVREMWERAFTFPGVRQRLRTDPVGGRGAALPLRRVQGAALRSARRRAHRGRSPTSSSGSASWSARSTRACSTSGSSSPTRTRPLDAPVSVPARPRPLTGNERAFTAMVRNALFRRVELFARRRWYDLGLSGRRLRVGRPSAGRTSSTTYFAEHDERGHRAPTPGARRCSIIDRQPGLWRVRQILDDPDGDHDWGFDVEVDLEASDEEGAAVVRMVDAGRLD